MYTGNWGGQDGDCSCSCHQKPLEPSHLGKRDIPFYVFLKEGTPFRVPNSIISMERLTSPKGRGVPAVSYAVDPVHTPIPQDEPTGWCGMVGGLISGTACQKLEGKTFHVSLGMENVWLKEVSLGNPKQQGITAFANERGSSQDSQHGRLVDTRSLAISIFRPGGLTLGQILPIFKAPGPECKEWRIDLRPSISLKTRLVAPHFLPSRFMVQTIAVHLID